MKTKFIFLLVFGVFWNINAQFPVFNNSAFFSGIGNGQGITIDISGNIINTGFYSGVIDLDPAATTNTVQTKGMYDIYLAKYNQTGQMLWGFSIGSDQNEGTNSQVITDVAGNIYLSGTFRDTMDVDPGLSVNNIISNGGFDFFYAKYNSVGQLVYGYSIGSANDDWCYDIKLDNSGNIYLCGNIGGITDFDPSLSTSSYSTSSTSNPFLAKYNSLGQYQWADVILSGPFSLAYCLTIDNLGDIGLSGAFSGVTDFDPSISTVTLSAFSTSDLFVAKYNSLGQYLWAFNVGNPTGNSGSYDIVHDSGNNLYVTGFLFGGPHDFDPSPSTQTLSAPGFPADLFLAKYNGAGQYQWAFSAGSPSGDENPSSICFDGSSNVYICGSYQYTVDFDPSPAVANLISTGSYDIFVVGYNSLGQYQSAFSLGDPNPGNNRSNGSGISYRNNKFAITGKFEDSLDVCPGPCEIKVSSGPGSDNIFWASYTQTTTAVNENILSTESIIFPNPTNSEFFIQTKVKEQKSIKVYNSNGKEVYLKKSDQLFVSIDLSGFANGIYLLNILYDSGKTETTKIIKQ